jgi:hypothetical protein
MHGIVILYSRFIFCAKFCVTNGTWQFISVKLVKNKHAKHDLESSFYVFVWVILMYTESYLTTPALALLIKKVFEAEEIDEIELNTKLAFLISRWQTTGSVFIECKVLNRHIFILIDTLY